MSTGGAYMPPRTGTAINMARARNPVALVGLSGVEVASRRAASSDRHRAPSARKLPPTEPTCHQSVELITNRATHAVTARTVMPTANFWRLVTRMDR